MNLLMKTKTLRWSTIITWIYIILVTILSLLYFMNMFGNGKIDVLIGGALASIVVAIIQFIIQYNDIRNNEVLQKNGVINFLESRDDKKYYKSTIDDTNKYLKLIFYTGKRFSEDFCQNHPNDDAIISALQRGVKIQMLLISKDLLPQDEIANFEIANRNFTAVKEKYPDGLKIKYYQHIQTHNIFRNEKSSIIGPYFHNKKSKYSHSIHFYNTSSYIEDFMDYFEQEWESANWA